MKELEKYRNNLPLAVMVNFNRKLNKVNNNYMNIPDTHNICAIKKRPQRFAIALHKIV